MVTYLGKLRFAAMTDGDIAGVAVLIILTPIVINNALDFLVPGRWERRAYKNSMRDLKRWIDKRNREK